MRFKATFIIGFGAGYVLGARAGRERFETIARGARRLMENPAVQETAGLIGAQAAGFVGEARRTVVSSVSHRRSDDSDIVHSHNGHGA